MLFWTVRGNLHRGDATDEASYLFEEISVVSFKATEKLVDDSRSWTDVTIGRHIEELDITTA
jgi:hypothetical protein